MQKLVSSFVAVVLLALSVGGCSGVNVPIACNVQAKNFVSQADKLLEDWDAANSLASSTGRIALPGPVSKM